MKMPHYEMFTGSTIRTPLNARSPINVQRHKMIPQKFVVKGEEDLNQLLRLQNRLILEYKGVDRILFSSFPEFLFR
uniref:Uncharacterized protein n=1 Tax=Ascaris lumbricoides TaxID=6252 RepID=A0A0M3HG55_ASCLU